MNKLAFILTRLSDNLDKAGFNTYADSVDRLLEKTATGQDFGDLLNMFDEPVVMEVEEEEMPGGKHRLQEQEEVFVPVDEEESTRGRKQKEIHENRMDMIKRRNELLKLKKMLDKDDKDDAEEAAAERTRIDKEFESMERAGVGKDIAKHLNEEFGDSEEEDFEDENDADDDRSPQERRSRAGILGRFKDAIDAYRKDSKSVKNRQLLADTVMILLEEHPWLEDSIADELLEMISMDSSDNLDSLESKDLSNSRTVRERESGQLEQPYEKFEDEDENMADDDGMLSILKEKLEDVPELAKKLFALIKNNPELLGLILA